MKKNLPPSDPPCATEAEIETAIEALSTADLLRLSRYAEFRARALTALGFGINGDDLIQEALKRTLAGQRRWPKAVSFVKYLIKTIQSVSSGAAKTAHGATFVSEDDCGDDSEMAEAQSCWLDSISPNSNPERAAGARLEAGRIERLFANDERVLLVMAGLAEGLTGPEIQKCLEISQTGYETIMKRLRRGAREKDKHADAR